MKTMNVFILLILVSCGSLSNKDKTTISNAEAYNSCMVGMRNILTDEFGDTRAEIDGKEKCISFLAPVMSQIRAGYYNDDTGENDNEKYTLDTIIKSCRIPAEKVMIEMQAYYKRFNRPEMYDYQINKNTISIMCPESELKKFASIYVK